MAQRTSSCFGCSHLVRPPPPHTLLSSLIFPLNLSPLTIRTLATPQPHTMPPLPRWLDKARATSARLISSESDPQASSTRPPTTSRSILARARSARKPTREVDNYADIPPFLLPLSVRVQLDRERAKHKARSRAAPYDKTPLQVQAKVPVRPLLPFVFCSRDVRDPDPRPLPVLPSAAPRNLHRNRSRSDPVRRSPLSRCPRS